MEKIDTKLKVAILRVLEEARSALGGAVIARKIQAYGLDYSDRTIRFYLKKLEQDGLVSPAGRGRKGGRMITPQGAEEFQRARVVDRLGFTAARVDALAWEMDFDLMSRSGRVVLNVTIVDECHLRQAIAEMTPVFEAQLGMGEYLALATSGHWLGDTQIPEGKAGIGTICSVTLNGVLLKARIPTISRFGGVLEIDGGEPERFTDVIYYEGTTLDPLEIFIKAGLTSVRDAVRTGRGRIGVSFREIPTVAMDEVRRIRQHLRRIGLHGILTIGKPNQPLVDFPVHEGRTALLVRSGLNASAAIEEAGIPTINFGLYNLFEFEKMEHFSKIAERFQ